MIGESCKEPAYRRRLRSTRSDELFMQMMQRVVMERKYLDPDYSAAQLAADLSTNTRYISAVVALHTGQNFSQFINSYRLRARRVMLIIRPKRSGCRAVLPHARLFIWHSVKCMM